MKSGDPCRKCMIGEMIYLKKRTYCCSNPDCPYFVNLETPEEETYQCPECCSNSIRVNPVTQSQYCEKRGCGYIHGSLTIEERVERLETFIQREDMGNV